MLFLSGLGQTAPLLPEVPSRNRVPLAPSNAVPAGWDGRVPAVPRANRVPRRSLQQRMLVAYPAFEPTFPPPSSVRADWQPPQMQMVNGLGGLSAPLTRDQVAAATATVYGVALRAIEPFYAWIGSLSPDNREETMGGALDELRAGGGARVGSTYRALLSTGLPADTALRRALAKEFAATALNPRSNVREILSFRSTGVGSIDDLRDGANRAADVAGDISCNETVQAIGGGIAEFFGADGEETEEVLEQTCKVATVTERVTRSPAQPQAAPQRQQRQVPREWDGRAPGSGHAQRETAPQRETTPQRRRPSLAEQAEYVRGQFRGRQAIVDRQARAGVREGFRPSRRPGRVEAADRDIAIILARRATPPAPIQVDGEGMGLGKMLLAGGAALGGYWLWKRRGKTTVRTKVQRRVAAPVR